MEAAEPARPWPAGSPPARCWCWAGGGRGRRGTRPARPARLGQQQRRAPVVVHASSRAPARRACARVNSHQPSGMASWIWRSPPPPARTGPRKIGLAGVVGPVGEPHGQRRDPSRCPRSMTARLCSIASLPTPRIGVAEGAELVGDRPVAGGRRVVLERVGVHGVEPEAERRRCARAGRRGRAGSSHGTCRLIVRLAPVDGGEGGDVVDLLHGRPGLAAAGEPAERGCRRCRPPTTGRRRRTGPPRR